MRSLITFMALVFGLIIGSLFTLILLDNTQTDARAPQSLDIFLFDKPEDKLSPSDHITEDQIKVYKNRVILNITGARWSRFLDTNSMDPLIDIGANGIEIVPKSPTQIKAGDVISYTSERGIVIHRVIAVDKDEHGIFYIVKGDNNPFADQTRVRFSDIKGILAAIIY